MKIDTLCNINDKIFTMYRNECYEVSIVKINVIVEQSNTISISYTARYVDKDIKGFVGDSFLKEIQEDRVFLTKQDLLNSL